jgi:hypothetical protein
MLKNFWKNFRNVEELNMSIIICGLDYEDFNLLQKIREGLLGTGWKTVRTSPAMPSSFCFCVFDLKAKTFEAAAVSKHSWEMEQWVSVQQLEERIPELTGKLLDRSKFPVHAEKDVD